MYKFGLKTYIIVICLLIQNVWALKCSYENRSLDTLTDMAWHVVTVKATDEDFYKKKNGYKIKITSILARTTDDTDEKPLADAEIVDLSCKNAILSKAGDYCRYKLRMPYKADYPDKKSVEATVNTFYKDVADKEMGLCSEENDQQIRFNFRKNDFISLVRFAVAEEYDSYPALHQLGEQEYAVLVVENGNTREMKLSGIKISQASWLTLINKKNSDSDPLYGSNMQCSDKEDKGDGLTVNKLKHAGDSCILVYDIKGAPLWANNPSIDIEILAGGAIKQTESIRVDQVLKPMKVVISDMSDMEAIGVQTKMSSDPDEIKAPQHVMTVQNYYSSNIIKPIIKIYNEANDDEVKDKFAVIASTEDCIKNPKDCNKFDCNLTASKVRCNFRIIPKSAVGKDGSIWEEFRPLHGSYYVRVFYNGQIVSDKVPFKILNDKETSDAADAATAGKGRSGGM